MASDGGASRSMRLEVVARQQRAATARRCGARRRVRDTVHGGGMGLWASMVGKQASGVYRFFLILFAVFGLGCSHTLGLRSFLISVGIIGTKGWSH